jgi:hypothetical protein
MTRSIMARENESLAPKGEQRVALMTTKHSAESAREERRVWVTEGCM